MTVAASADQTSHATITSTGVMFTARACAIPQLHPQKRQSILITLGMPALANGTVSSLRPILAVV